MPGLNRNLCRRLLHAGTVARCRILLPIGIVLLSSCAVGPRYVRPPAPAVSGYVAATDEPADGAPRFRTDARVDPSWWRSFASADLDRLVAEALRNNQDLAAADATLAATRAELQASRGVLFPQVDLSLGASRQRPSPAVTGSASGAYDLFTGQAQVSYDPGLFGLNHHLIASAEARADIAASRLAAARLLIAGNVVQSVFHLASLGDQLQTLRQTVADEREILALVESQYRLGAVDQSAVLTQQSLLASSRAQQSGLAQAQDAARHLLASFLGRYPADAGTLVVPAFEALSLPAELPLSLPSTLVAARPDIRAAEAALRGANAELGAAVAGLYPQLRIDATYGGAGRTTGDSVLPFNRLWSVGGALLAPVFEGGRLRAEKRAAEANYRALLATYRSTVLDAFRNVADVLRALQHDNTLVSARTEAAASADAALALNLARYRAGDVDYLEVLSSQIVAQAARIARIDAEAQRYGDTAALYVALGGGDWAGRVAENPPINGQSQAGGGRP